MATAVQTGLRNRSKPPTGVAEIGADFGLWSRFRGGRVLELGPGHYEFADLARDCGAAEVVAIDHDPAVVELGRYRGFTAVEGDYRTTPISELVDERKFDAVLARGSFNAFWFPASDDDLAAWIRALAALIAPDGWALLAPWNNAAASLGLTDERIGEVLERQISVFSELGFFAFTPNEAYRGRWYVSPGETANNVVFCKRLPPPPAAVLEAHSAPPAAA